jgi:hypothetical protein
MAICGKCGGTSARAIVRGVAVDVCESKPREMHIGGFWAFWVMLFPKFDLITFYGPGDYWPALWQHLNDDGNDYE